MAQAQTATTPKDKLGRATLRALGRKKRKAKLRRSKANHGKRPNMGRG